MQFGKHDPVKSAVTAICVGQPQPFNGAELSSFVKQPLEGPALIRFFGIVGDMQADSVNHGGPDMAVHLYPADHYAWWAERLGRHPVLRGPAPFGENLMAAGLTEDQVHIGDRFRLGSALLEVSQPRRPCWKIEHRFAAEGDAKGMVKAIIKHHNCGWYFRVIEEGEAHSGDVIERVASGAAEWSIARAFAKFYDPSQKASADDLASLSTLQPLSAVWREKASAMLKQLSGE